MLLNLHVKNMALIRELEVDFEPGLNILTGETGAGKSILIGSINVALGMQGFKGFARADADSALVELVFSAEGNLAEKIEALGIAPEDGQVILSRRLTGGRTINKVNGETVPVSMIRELGALLIDIHGQHEHQSLLYQKNHLRILDEFAKDELAPLKKKSAKLYETYCAYKKQREHAALDESARKKEMDFLLYETQEISGSNLRPGEDEDLEQQYRKMANAKRIAQDVSEAYQLTSQGQANAADCISGALHRLLAVSGFDPELSEYSAQLDEIENLLADFNRALDAYLDSLTFDEAEFMQMEERLDRINHLKAKYGKTIADILQYKEEKEKRLQELQDYDTYLADLERNYNKSKEELQKNAQAMSEIRKRCAKQLAKKITEQLVDLNFLETRFEITVEATAPLGADGFDEACFMICMNPGSPMRPLADVASGGELSRIMLAIKTVLAAGEDIPTMIFDEIDTGISGRTAQKVSEKMAVIAQKRQVLCITHLAQIAAMADRHLRIEKSLQDDAAVTTIRPLARKESIEELARILGGAQITELTRQSAQEMKEMAERTKKY